jgi:hypothetical protein
MLKTLLFSAGVTVFLSEKNKNITKNTEISPARHAICILYPHGNSGVHGLVSFS